MLGSQLSTLKPEGGVETGPHSWSGWDGDGCGLICSFSSCCAPLAPAHLWFLLHVCLAPWGDREAMCLFESPPDWGVGGGQACAWAVRCLGP